MQRGHCQDEGAQATFRLLMEDLMEACMCVPVFFLLLERQLYSLQAHHTLSV